MASREQVKPIRVAGREIGPGRDVFLIAEVGNAHDGSLNTAHAFIDAVKHTGAHAIKFQTHIAAAEGTAREQFRVRFSYADETRGDYWRRMQFTAQQWQGLKDHADEAGLIFLSSPFSPAAVELMEKLGMPAWKVGSGETNNYPMLEMMMGTGKPLLISTGMSYLREIKTCVDLCRSRSAEFMLFHCTTSYPCPPEKVGLNVMTHLAEEHACPVGLSDHSGDLFASLAAATLGANAIEVHVCLSKDSFGPDVPASLTPAELTRLSQGLLAVRTMLTHPVDKDEHARQLEPMRKLFCKSIVFTRALPAGTQLALEHLTGKKPGDGVPVAQLSDFVGRRLARDVQENEQLSAEVLE